jgi:NAD(P)H dehydrogenase (quinone)
MIAVSGASGNLGRLVLARLLELADACEVVALSRDPAAVGEAGCRVRGADFGDPAGLAGALEGVERMLMVSLPPVPERALLQRTAVEAAVEAGVEHIIYTSLTRAGEPGNPVGLAADHGSTERVLAGIGIDFTVLRFNIWPEMWEFTGMAQRAVETGVLFSNAGEGRVGHVTRADAAAVAAAVLAEGSCRGQFVEVTGPSADSDEDVAAALAAATGRRVECRRVADDELAPALVAQGIAEPFARGWSATGVARREGWFDVTTHAVERLTGRRPASVADYFATSFG